MFFYASPKEYWRECWPNYSHVQEKSGISRHLNLIWIKPNGSNILTWENPNVRTECYRLRKHTHAYIYIHLSFLVLGEGKNKCGKWRVIFNTTCSFYWLSLFTWLLNSLPCIIYQKILIIYIMFIQGTILMLSTLELIICVVIIVWKAIVCPFLYVSISYTVYIHVPGVVAFFVLIGFFGLILHCSSLNSNDPRMAGCQNCCYGWGILDCFPASMEACFALVVVFVVIFAILGVAYGFLASTMAIQRIWQRHYHILTKRELTKVRSLC